MQKRNILVSTLGTTWQVIPEIIGFTNPRQVPLYSNHKEYIKIDQYRREHLIPEIDLVWCITTDHSDTHRSSEELMEWFSSQDIQLQLKLFFLKGVKNLYTEKECRFMTDLIYRVTHTASRECNGGKLLLSLAGGRKTMSADMQEAGHLFGCDFLFHVIEGGVTTNHKATYKDHTSKYAFSDNVMPIVISDRIPANPIIQIEQDIEYPDILEGNADSSDETRNIVLVQPSLVLVDEIRNRKMNAGSLIYNYIRHISGSGEKTNFRALYTLSPNLIQDLKTDYIGIDPEKRMSEIEWLRKLPKCDLHCHLGGIAAAGDMITIALSNHNCVENMKKSHNGFKSWIQTIEQYVRSNDLSGLKKEYGHSGKRLRTLFPDIPEPYTVAAFLSCFRNNIELLDKLIYRELLTDKLFAGIGIERYEALGDVQGSGLLQSEESLRAICRLLIEKSKAENITYAEIRCSPVNYTRGTLSSGQVVEIITQELSSADSTIFRLIFIGSRHGRTEDMKAHIDLASRLFIKDSENLLSGFDLAGNEASKRPGEVKDLFLPLMENCINITIHAGEGADPQNIWEAVYQLSADRIGHGLTIHENERLFRKLVDRKITIELCPSSNMQIVGYFSPDTPSFKTIYPLQLYMDRGLTVTVNTDNPGISRTTLTDEFYRATRMTPKGLSKWNILQLIKNGFKSSFADHETRRDRLLDAEGRIMKQLIEAKHEK